MTLFAACSSFLRAASESGLLDIWNNYREMDLEKWLAGASKSCAIVNPCPAIPDFFLQPSHSGGPHSRCKNCCRTMATQGRRASMERGLHQTEKGKLQCRLITTIQTSRARRLAILHRTARVQSPHSQTVRSCQTSAS